MFPLSLDNLDNLKFMKVKLIVIEKYIKEHNF